MILNLNLNVLLCLGIMIFSGMLCGRLVKQIKLPNVTGYLIAGLLLGPSVLNLVPEGTLDAISLISEVALGFIAFSIGNEFKLSYFKRVGLMPIVIAVFESLFAVLFVLAGLLIAGNSLPFSLVLSAIAAATAPAATIMVINQYKAKGPVTETLLSVVAIDDATALMLFGIATAIAQMIANPGDTSLAQAILSPIIEIAGSILIGFALGLLFTVPMRWFKKDGNRLSLTVGFLFVGLGIASLLNLSSLLLCMAMGAALTNFSSQVDHIAKLTDQVTPPVFLLFFVASGAELKLSAIPAIGVVGILYIILRVAGKYAGTLFGAALCKAEKKIRLWLGPALIPQAGVAIGLSLAATRIVPEYGATIRTVILCATLIYELIGPGITKLSLTKAGEITPVKR